MIKGGISLEDAQLVHEFALHVQPILRHADSIKLAEQAKTVARISYCAMADARQKARAKRAMLQENCGDPYITEISE